MRYLIIFFILISCLSFGQKPGPIKIDGLPTTECYDLLFDSKGYLWIGHDLGISRFDGKKFIHFNHPVQTSLSITGLTEDKYGRVWCNDLSGHIFYFENEQMHFADIYPPNERFPRITIMDDELIATHKDGLFIYNIKTGQKRILGPPIPNKNITSIANLQDRIIAHEYGELFEYRKGYTKLKHIGRLPAHYIEDWRRAELVTQARKDSFFFITNASNLVLKLVYKNNRIRIIDSVAQQTTLNTVTLTQNDVWINTKNNAYSLSKNDTIAAVKDVSDIVKDANGNTWISSLKNGLFKLEKQHLYRGATELKLEKGEYLKTVVTHKDYCIWGTTERRIIIQQGNKVIYTHTLPIQTGNIEKIFKINDTLFIVAGSLGYGRFLLNQKQLKFETTLNIKDMAFNDSIIYYASSSGLIQKKISDIHSYGSFINQKRVNAVELNPMNKTLYYATIDGLFSINGNQTNKITYKNSIINASSITYANKSMYVGSYNKGLFIITKDSVKNITKENGLLLNNILKVKKINDSILCLLSNRRMQFFNCYRNSFIDSLNTLNFISDIIYDVHLVNNIPVALTSSGMYKLQKKNPKLVYQTVMLYAIVNNKDSIFSNTIHLPYRNNNIELHYTSSAIPFNSLQFKYRMKGTDSAYWDVTEDNSGIVRFSSLEPGSYTFEIYPIADGKPHPENLQQIHIDIAKPFWMKWWFFVVIGAIPAIIILSIYRSKIHQRNQITKLRENISSDLHDDIGSVISSINIYSSIAKSQERPDVYIDLIQIYAQEVIAKLDDLVWSIKSINDHYEHLIERMQSFALPVLHAAAINTHFHTNLSSKKLSLNLEEKRNLYLLFKEAINNVVKHSKATNCTIRCIETNGLITISIHDDGTGFDTNNLPLVLRTGVSSMKERAAKIHAALTIESHPEKGTKINISKTLDHNSLLKRAGVRLRNLFLL